MSFWRGKKVTVTGGAGFIGSYLCELLIDAQAELTIADNLVRGGRSRIEHLIGPKGKSTPSARLVEADLFDYQQCLAVCEGQEVVLNLAAKVTGIEYNRFHMADMFESNMKLQMNVLQAASAAGVKRFLQVSTACIYPHDAKVPTPESEGERGSPEPTNEGYGLAKLMGEKLAKYYAAEKKMHVVIGRPFNAYGPRDHYDEATSHVIPAIMKRILDGENPVRIWGSGRQSRAFVHAKDIARGMMLVTEFAPPAMPINIGHDQEVSIRDLFELICEVVGKRPDPFFDSSKPDGYARRAADTTLLRQTTGFVPAISLKEGIRQMLDEFLSRQSNITAKKK